MENSVIKDYSERDIIHRDISCNLGSLNIDNVMETKSIQDSVYAGMDALTSVSLMSSVKNAPTVAKANRELHSVGLGALNLNGYLAKHHLMYESEEAKDFSRTFFMMMNFYSIDRSNQIAQKYGTFKDFAKSDYATGEYFIKYLNTDYSPQTEKVKALFEGITIPTENDWRELMNRVKRSGLFHAYRMAIAPTQSIGYVQNATQSVMPVTHLIEPRRYGDLYTYFPMPYLSPQIRWFYKSAYNIDPMKEIDLIAEIQQHVDQGVSTILYVDDTTPTNLLARYYTYAHHKGLKSVYYVRTRRTTTSIECDSCSI